jgi:hypothetical protein
LLPVTSALNGNGIRRSFDENSSFDRPAMSRVPSTYAMSVTVEVRIGRRRMRIVRSPIWSSSPSAPWGRVMSCRSSSGAGASAIGTSATGTWSSGTSMIEPSR